MMRFTWWLPAVTTAVVVWQECAENPFVFCYRIGWGTYANLRSRSVVPIHYSARHEPVCLNPSFTFSTRSTTPTVSEN
jgi:hypothetical protein